MVELGTRSATIASLVLLRSDGTTLVGEAAERRALIEPERMAREFKRRLGDSVPLLLGGTPYSAEALTAKVLRLGVPVVTTFHVLRLVALVLSAGAIYRWLARRYG